MGGDKNAPVFHTVRILVPVRRRWIGIPVQSEVNTDIRHGTL